MSKTPWTPGPWRVDPRYPGDVQTVDSRFEICTPWYAEMAARTCFPQGEPISQETAKANARLIAAAPEMAEVLECLANMARHFPNIPTYGNRPRTGNIYTVADGQGEASITVEDLHRAAALLARIRGETP